MPGTKNDSWITRGMLLGALCTLGMLFVTGNFVLDYRSDLYAAEERARINKDQKEERKELSNEINNIERKVTAQVENIRIEIKGDMKDMREEQKGDLKEIKELIKNSKH